MILFPLKMLPLFGGILDVTSVKRGSDPITTWGGLKKELKKQFYTKDAEY